MNRNWQASAQTARSILADAPHGQRETALRRAFAESGWKDINTVRRAVSALTYLDELQRTHPHLYEHLRQAPMSVVEALARLRRLDQFGALRAASEWSEGKSSLQALREAAKSARPAGLAGRSGQFLEDEYRQRAEKSVRGTVQRLIGGRVSNVHTKYKDRPEAPTLDYVFSSTTKGPHSTTQTIAVLIVGPYQNGTLYRKRRFDWMLRGFGLAWSYDHVVLVLPAKEYLADYTTWISHYRQSVSKHQLSISKAAKVQQMPPTHCPSVHAISVNIPQLDSQDDAAIASLPT